MRAKRSARPPGYVGLAWMPLKATSTTSSGLTCTTCPSCRVSSSSSSAVTGPKVKIGEPAAAAAVAPFGREHDEVEGVSGLQLEPCGAARASIVARVQRLGHQPFVSGRDRPFEERPGFARVRRHDPGHALLARHDRGEDREPRSEEHTSELQSLTNLVCRLLLEKKKKKKKTY